MLNCNPCRTPVDTEKKLGPEGSSVTDPTLYRSLARALQYLTFTRPNLSYEVQQLFVRLPDPKLKTLGERGIECIFVGYAEYSKAFRFYVNEPNDPVSINSIIESKDAIFDENRFSLVPRPSQRSLVNETEDIGCSVVPEEVTGEYHKTADCYGIIHNLIIHQMDVNTAFLNGDLDEEQAPKQWHQKFDEVVDMTKEFLSSKFSMKDIGEADVILGIRIKHESNEIADMYG
ncbi:zinc finger, CCHC-type containing protein [Tanacetum coccineum]|uniref:Zinc finger, CCHC-type containing protein n=1 Tax=Tanacetum coccineum TaxID=301880 RepID=A0ABQ5I4Q2_9ASTR